MKQKLKPKGGAEISQKQKALSVQNRTWPVLTVGIIIALLTFIVFSPSLKCGFTNWDDKDYVQDNALVVNNSIPLKAIFETPVMANYHPITMLTLALNYQFSKLDPRPYHAWNVWLHVMNTLLVFGFIFLLTDSNLLMASIVALFFGIHPMHVESVTWISERKDVLYVFFFIGGLITYLLYLNASRRIWYAVTMLLFLLSCLSKAMAVVFPMILLLVDYFKGIKPGKKNILEKIPFFIFSLGFGVLAIIAQQKTMSLTKVFSIGERFMFACYGAVMYIVKMIVPAKLAPFYPYPTANAEGRLPLIFYMAPVIIIVLIVAVYFYIKKKKDQPAEVKSIVFGSLFFVAAVVLVLQFVSVGQTIMTDRFSYLAYIGLFFVVAHFANKTWQANNTRWNKFKYPVSVILIIGAIAFSIQTYAQTQIWTNSKTLWEDMIKKYPESSIGYAQLGLYYQYESMELDKALQNFNLALERNPKDFITANNLGKLYFDKGNDNLALNNYNEAIRSDSTYAVAYYNRGALYFKQGKDELAMNDFNRSLQLNPKYPYSYNDRGIIYFNKGDNEHSLQDFNYAIKLKPAFANAYCNRGLVYYVRKNYPQALNDFSSAIELDPRFAQAFFNRATVYNSMANYEKAIADLSDYLNLMPSDHDAYNFRGKCFLALHNYNSALSDFTKATNINAAVAEYWLNRSRAQKALGHPDQAFSDSIKGMKISTTDIGQ